MHRPLLTLLALAGFALAIPAATADLGQTAPPKCVEYAYVADYHWYRLCWDPRDLSCPVYFEEQHGVTVTRECAVDASGVETMEPVAFCVPTSGGLDYPSWLCVDAGDLKCPVYTITTSDWGVRKTCVPPRLG